MPSALGAAIRGLVSNWSGLTGLTGIPVYNGAPMSDQAATSLICVGDDGNPDSTESSTIRQTWLDLAHTRRAENGEIIGVCIVMTGGIDLSIAETNAFAYLGYCEQALRSDPTISGIVQSSEFVSGEAQLIQNANGAAIVVPFIVAYFAVV